MGLERSIPNEIRRLIHGACISKISVRRFWFFQLSDLNVVQSTHSYYLQSIFNKYNSCPAAGYDNRTLI